MRTLKLIGAVSLVALAGCGLEGFLSNQGHTDYERPASKLRGAVAWTGAQASQFSAIDGDGTDLAPFQTSANEAAKTYEVRLASGRYSMIRAKARAGNLEARSIVPFIGPESALEGVNFDARAITETLIVEARLRADGKSFKKLTPEAYLGTRALIQAAIDQPGDIQDLYKMVQVFVGKADAASGGLDPDFFLVPEYGSDFVVKPGKSAISASFLARNDVDYAGLGHPIRATDLFDQKLALAAQKYDPAGCDDPAHVQLMFTVDFSDGAKNGNCNTIPDKFKWATDKPGKRMFFVGWIHEKSDVQDPAVNALIGGSSPNTLPMYDDGTNGDEVAGDNLWTIVFKVPYDASKAKILRVGYKYTWGTQGQGWTGSEEWPGNSRILEVVDVNNDGFVYRRDVWADEASNKDKSNLNLSSGGVIDFSTVLHPGCGPESQEHKVTLHNACRCDDPPLGLGFVTPQSIGPLKVACSAP